LAEKKDVREERVEVNRTLFKTLKKTLSIKVQ
jgi:hypothetical protein